MASSKALKQMVKLMKNSHIAYNLEAKEQFQKLSKQALHDISDELDLKHCKIWFNPGGDGVSGEAHLMAMPTWGDKGIYITISQGLHLPFMYRTIKGMSDYTGGANNWMSFYELDDTKYIANKIKRLMEVIKNEQD